MTMANRCPGCGNFRPADAPRGFCPACLLRAGRDDWTATCEPTTGQPTSQSGPVASSAFAALTETQGTCPRILLNDPDPDFLTWLPRQDMFARRFYRSCHDSHRPTPGTLCFSPASSTTGLANRATLDVIDRAADRAASFGADLRALFARS
jgi:hypothetical protein